LAEIGTNVEVGNITPLAVAAEKGADDAIGILLECGANPDNSGSSDRGPLYDALKSGNIEAVKLLVESGANVNGSDKMPKITPLHKAIKYKFLDAIELLIKHGADMYKEGYHEGSPFIYAVKNPPCEQILHFLYKCGVTMPKITFFSNSGLMYKDPGFYAAEIELQAIYKHIREAKLNILVDLLKEKNVIQEANPNSDIHISELQNSTDIKITPILLKQIRIDISDNLLDEKVFDDLSEEFNIKVSLSADMIKSSVLEGYDDAHQVTMGDMALMEAAENVV